MFCEQSFLSVLHAFEHLQQQQQQQPLFISHTYLYNSADPQSSRDTNRGGSGTDKISIYIIYR